LQVLLRELGQKAQLVLGAVLSLFLGMIATPPAAEVRIFQSTSEAGF
jgi:hypothetical protein